MVPDMDRTLVQHNILNESFVFLVIFPNDAAFNSTHGYQEYCSMDLWPGFSARYPYASRAFLDP